MRESLKPSRSWASHYCGKQRSNGAFIVWRKTAKKRMVARLRAIKEELRRRMHEPTASVGEWLQKVVMGYYRYHAVPGNLDRLRVFGRRIRVALQGLTSKCYTPETRNDARPRSSEAIWAWARERAVGIGTHGA